MRSVLGSASSSSGVISIAPMWSCWGIMLPGHCLSSKPVRSDRDDISRHSVHSFKHLYCTAWPSYWSMPSQVTEIHFSCRKLNFWRIHYNINHLLYQATVTTLPSCGSSMIGINHYISHLLDHCKSSFLSPVLQLLYLLCAPPTPTPILYSLFFQKATYCLVLKRF